MERRPLPDNGRQPLGAQGPRTTRPHTKPHSHVLTKLTQGHAQGHLRGATRSRQDRRGFFLGRSAASRSFLYVPSVEKKFTVKRLGSLAPGSLSYLARRHRESGHKSQFIDIDDENVSNIPDVVRIYDKELCGAW